MYVLRRAATMRVKQALGVSPKDGCREFYCCSLSSRTIVYKGQLTPEQARPRPRATNPPTLHAALTSKERC